MPTKLFWTANIQRFLISTRIKLENIIAQCYLLETLLIQHLQIELLFELGYNTLRNLQHKIGYKPNYPKA